MSLASLYDVAFAAVEGPSSPGDFAVLLHFTPGHGPDLATLEAGACSAREAYPRSAARLVGNRWCGPTSAPPGIRSVRFGEEEFSSRVRELLAEPLRAGDPWLLRQVLLESPGRTCLLTRMHHALGDLLSAVLFLRCQLDGVVSPAQLELRRHERPVRRSPDAPGLRSQPLARAAGSEPTGRRGWLSLAFDAREPAAGFTYNDLLASVALRTVQEWNDQRGPQPTRSESEAVGLWMPMNLRTRPFEGFGNGSSRIRAYAREGVGGTVKVAASIREQVRWSKEHGEWAAPPWTALLMRAPPAFGRALLRRRARSRRVDMATTLFSHLERLSPSGEVRVLSSVERVEVVTHLIPAHPMTLAAVGLHGRTHLTLTWDEGLYSSADAAHFAERFERHRVEAFDEMRAATRSAVRADQREAHVG